MRSLSVLGATGSVGASTLDLVRCQPGAWQIKVLTANCQAADLAALAREFSAEIAVVADEACLPDLRAALAGRTTSPSVFDMMLVIGRDETIARLQDAAP